MRPPPPLGGSSELRTRQVSWLTASPPTPSQVSPVAYVGGSSAEHSGGAAPDSHRLPYSPLPGHLARMKNLTYIRHPPKALVLSSGVLKIPKCSFPVKGLGDFARVHHKALDSSSHKEYLLKRSSLGDKTTYQNLSCPAQISLGPQRVTDIYFLAPSFLSHMTAPSGPVRDQKLIFDYGYTTIGSSFRYGAKKWYGFCYLPQGRGSYSFHL